MPRNSTATRFGASLGVTGLLVAGAVAFVPTQAVAQQACYPPVPVGQDCAGNPTASPTGGVGGIGSPAASPTGSPEASPVASASPSGSPEASAPASPSASPTRPGNQPPTPPGCLRAAEVMLERDTIIATGSSGMTVTATPNSIVDVFAYTRPSSTYRLVRSAELGESGTAEFRIVPPGNTRLYAQQRGCAIGKSKVLNVRTALSLFATRNGVRNYTFSGQSMPARSGGLIVSLYRVTDDGRQVLTAQARANAGNGRWTINRVFTGSGRFGFVVRTGQDLQNAPGASNVRSTLIF